MFIKCSLLLTTTVHSEYVGDDSCLVSVKAVQSIGRIGVRLPDCCELCVDRLTSLLNSATDHVISETLVTLTSKCT